jgi:ribosome maturation factor RimP
MTDAEDRLSTIESAVSPVMEAHGLALVDLEFRREGRRWVLRLFVDKPGGVAIADCQRVSHELGDVLDVTGLIEESYDLEVSSPGLQRELRKERELRWAIGKSVRCWVREPVDGRREFCGRLVECTGEHVVLSEGDGSAVALPRPLVTKVRLDPDLLLGGGRRR